MNVKNFLIGTVVGGIVSFLLGWLIYGIAMAGFYEANMIADPAALKAIMKDPPALGGYAVASLAQAALLSYIFIQWAGIKTFVTGAKAGAVIGLITGIAITANFYASMNWTTMTANLVEPIVSAVMYALVGGVVGLVLGKMSE